MVKNFMTYWFYNRKTIGYMFLCFTRFKAPYLSNKDMIQFSPFIGCINNDKPLEIMQIIIDLFKVNFQKACHNCVYLGFNVDTNEIVNQIGRNSFGCQGTALMQAVETDKIDVVKYLIQKGATISIENTKKRDGTKHGNTLHVAVISSNIQFGKLLHVILRSLCGKISLIYSPSLVNKQRLISFIVGIWLIFSGLIISPST